MYQNTQRTDRISCP